MLRLTFIADTHHYSKTLGTTGRAYCLRAGSDQKCLAETGDILDAAFEKLAQSDTDAVMIAGDVTNDGERASHLEFREKLYKLGERKRIFLITATHDWCCDENPRRFDGDTVTHDVDVMASDELPGFYRDFGVGNALSVFTTHIGTCSYVAQLSDKVRLLALNDDKNENHHAGFTEAHFQWIEQQIKQAYEDGCIIIGMQHHLLMPHISPLITGGACVADREYVAARLADAGLKYMFVGHSHLQSTAEFTSKKGNTIKEVNVGSLVGYPAPMVNVTVHEDMTIEYEVEYLESFCTHGRRTDAQEYLRLHAVDLLHRVFHSPSQKEFADRITALQGNGERIGFLFPILKRLFKHIKTDTVNDICRRLRRLGLGRYIDAEAAEVCANIRLLSIIDHIWLSLLDGSRSCCKRDDAYYRLIMSVISIPAKIFKNNNTFIELSDAMDAVLCGGKYNNQKDKL